MVTFVLSGCYKDAHIVDANFIGAWHSTNGTAGLEIFSESQGSYQIVGSGKITYGQVKCNSKYLKIDNLKFHINQFPQYDSTSNGRDYYSMILDDLVYVSGGF